METYGYSQILRPTQQPLYRHYWPFDISDRLDLLLLIILSAWQLKCISMRSKLGFKGGYTCIGRPPAFAFDLSCFHILGFNLGHHCLKRRQFSEVSV